MMHRIGLSRLLTAVLLSALSPAPGHAVVVGTAGDLAAAIQQANAGGDTSILLRDGVYTLDNMLWVSATGVSVSSLSGNRDAVIVQGHGMAGGVTHVFNVAGSGFSARNMTLRGVSQHAIQLQVNGAAVSLGGGVTVSNPVVGGSTQVGLTARIGRKAKRGPRDVAVTNPGGLRAICRGCFRIK